MSNGYDLRDHWECPTCGCGLCVAAGETPEQPQHVLADGRVCGTYDVSELGVDCFADTA